MISTAEQVASRRLRSVLAGLAEGEQITDSGEFGELQGALERFLPSVLRDAYPAQWRHEAFDGFRLPVARKSGPAEAELLGLGLLISDQTWTPFHVRLRAAPDTDAISWVLCRVGECGAAGVGVTRLPYESPKVSRLLAAVVEHPESVKWAFTVERS